jgi:hypothetical protein
MASIARYFTHVSDQKTALGLIPREISAVKEEIAVVGG